MRVFVCGCTCVFEVAMVSVQVYVSKCVGVFSEWEGVGVCLSVSVGVCLKCNAEGACVEVCWCFSVSGKGLVAVFVCGCVFEVLC